MKSSDCRGCGWNSLVSVSFGVCFIHSLLLYLGLFVINDFRIGGTSLSFQIRNVPIYGMIPIAIKTYFCVRPGKPDSLRAGYGEIFIQANPAGGPWIIREIESPTRQLPNPTAQSLSHCPFLSERDPCPFCTCDRKINFRYKTDARAKYIVIFAKIIIFTCVNEYIQLF